MRCTHFRNGWTALTQYLACTRIWIKVNLFWKDHLRVGHIDWNVQSCPVILKEGALSAATIKLHHNSVSRQYDASAGQLTSMTVHLEDILPLYVLLSRSRECVCVCTRVGDNGGPISLWR